MGSECMETAGDGSAGEGGAERVCFYEQREGVDVSGGAQMGASGPKIPFLLTCFTEWC